MQRQHLEGMCSIPNNIKLHHFSAGMQGLTGTTEPAGQSSGTTADTAADSNVTSGNASIQGQSAAHTPIRGVTGAIANATDAVSSLSRAAAAELGTEGGSITAQTGSRTNQSASPLLPGLPDSASKAASLANQRAAEAAQDKAEQRTSQQASTLTQPNGTAVNAQELNKQPHMLEDEVDAELIDLQNRHNASTATAGIGAKTARYADGQLITHIMSPSELAELHEEHDKYVDPTSGRAQAQHKTALGAGSHTSGRGSFPASTHSTQTGQLLGDDGAEYNPQAALGTNFQSGQ